MTHREAISLLDNPLLHNLTAKTTSILPATPATPSSSTTHAPLCWADLGCGSGTFTLALAHYLPSGSTVDALDLAPTIQRQTTNTNITILPRTANFTQPNLQLQNLDGILMANALHYVNDQPALLRSLHAALKPGGIFLLVEYDTDTPVPRWVPYPLSFTTATHLFAPPHWHHLQKGNTHPSAFGRSTLYTAYTTAS